MRHKCQQLRPGDIITSYYAGVWRVIDVRKRPNIGCVVTAQKILTRHFRPVDKSKINTCDEHWCRKVRPEQIGNMLPHWRDGFELLICGGCNEHKDKE